MRCFVVVIFAAITFSAATGRCQDPQFPPTARIASELQGDPENLPPLIIANEYSSASMTGAPSMIGIDAPPTQAPTRRGDYGFDLK